MFTDQDAAMANALSHVMPDTYHRLCTWHIMQNALKHIHGAFKGPDGVKNVLSKFMNEIEEQNEFLMAWNKILDDYDMHENSWMKSIFSTREKWAYAYVRHEWSAGMNTTQLSESFNASLKDYLKLDLNIAQFFIPFERVVNDKRYKEIEAKYDLCYRIKVPAKMLTQAREFYTKAIFEEFQVQFLEATELSLESCVDDDGSLLQIVTKDGSFKKWLVKRKSDNLLSCGCRMFEMKGVLCRHGIKVLREAMNVKGIPDQYLLKRWTKQARAEFVQGMHGHEIQADPKLQQTYQYRSLCSIFTRISNRVSESEKAYNVAHEHASNLARLVEDILLLEIAKNVLKTGYESEDVNLEMTSIQDSNLMKAQGLKKKESSCGRRRIKSSLEKGLGKMKEII
ncbi:hypothetical protein Ddye_023159 [Dipteronia dyeriana]|uniref:Protein FAR1-RELATED SEQUENCE n=1 Tax=Dipteronia dyeriana TaxID=168575 RepID=A0AAD9TSK2_9ROSI|nr:hypothetical protein Ddye_023159 [Dipteronia dyeriana]